MRSSSSQRWLCLVTAFSPGVVSVAAGCGGSAVTIGEQTLDGGAGSSSGTSASGSPTSGSAGASSGGGVTCGTSTCASGQLCGSMADSCCHPIPFCQQGPQLGPGPVCIPAADCADGGGSGSGAMSGSTSGASSGATSGSTSGASGGSGASGASSGGGTACTSDSECAEAAHCSFPVGGGCSALGSCAPYLGPGPACGNLQPWYACGCDGTEVYLGCGQAPATSAPTRVLHQGPCADGG
jgi:hypothetical protein